MTELHLFAGAGGGILGGLLLGHTPVCAVEIDPYCQEVLRARQRDGMLPAFPVYGDIRSFDGSPWKGRVDIVAGGFPCVDIATIGNVVLERKGIDGPHSRLWREMARIIGEVRPRYVFVENSPNLVRQGLTMVIGDLASLGYDARWTVLGAHRVGAPHRRNRIWILANANGEGLEERHWQAPKREARPTTTGGVGWNGEPRVLGVDDGLADKLDEHPRYDGPAAARVWSPGSAPVQLVARGKWDREDRLRAIGNGQVPQCAAAAWRELMSWEVTA